MKLALALMGLTAASSPTNALSPAIDNCMTLETAMNLSISRDPNVEAASAERLEAAAAVKDARALRRPKLDSFASNRSWRCRCDR